VLSPDDGAVLAARAVMRFHLRAFTLVEDDARAGEVEPVHQLRVATRRLRATLRLFAPLLPATFVEGMHRELAWVARAIGPVRDLDVLLEAVKARATRLDPALRKELGPVGIAVHDQRDVALAGLSEALGSSRCRRLLGRLHAFAESQARARRHQRLGAAAPGLLQPLVRAVRGAGRRLGPDSLPADFHRLRVRVKRLRYALETMRALGGKPVRRLLGELEELQDILGGSQDAVTQIAWLRAYASARGTPPSSLLPVGALIQALARRGEKRRRRGLKAWRKLDRSGLLEAVYGDVSGSDRALHGAAAVPV
jgi:CHAD domain-containing protein